MWTSSAGALVQALDRRRYVHWHFYAFAMNAPLTVKHHLSPPAVRITTCGGLWVDEEPSHATTRFGRSTPSPSSDISVPGQIDDTPRTAAGIISTLLSHQQVLTHCALLIKMNAIARGDSSQRDRQCSWV